MRSRAIRQAIGRTGHWPGLAALAAGLTLAAVLIFEFSAKQRTTHALNWMRDHWLNAIAITAIATVVAAATPVLKLIPRRQASENPSAERRARERRSILSRVRSGWITDILMSHYAEAPRLNLRRQSRPDLIAARIGRPSRRTEPIHATRTALQIFDNAEGTLLIAGAPGAGKSVFLLELAQDLIERAEADQVAAVPVVFNLASWGARRPTLINWIRGELTARYDVPRPTAGYWLAQDELVLLLDGFDEVPERHRAACAEAINEYRRDHGLVPIAVCTRTEQAENLPVRLSLHEAIEVQPPTDDQITSYLDDLEATGTQVADVRAALKTDPVMRELLHSPLMLHVMTLAYRGQPATGLAQPGVIGQRRERLWRDYVTQMLDRRPLRGHYTSHQAVTWLEKLAQAMQYEGQSEFHLDRLIARSQETADGMYYWPLPCQIVPSGREHFFAQKLHWRWKGFSHFSPAYAIGPLSVLYVATMLFTTYGWTWKVLVAMFAAPGISMLFLSRLTTEWSDSRVTPNEGIRRSARNGLIVGLATALILGAGFGVPFGPDFGQRVGEVVGLLAWTFYGGGAALIHYMQRAELAILGAIPWRYQSFLDDMADRLLMRRSGGTYLFIHSLLRDHLARSAISEPARGKHAVSR